MTPPNLMILGASGNVARALLRKLPAQRHRFGEIVLVDKSSALLRDRFLDLKTLQARFFRRRLDVKGEKIRRLLRRHQTDLVVDLTDLDTLPLLESVDAEGVGYINTCLNDGVRQVHTVFDEILRRKRTCRHAAHILCSGMNPGVVNLWVARGIERFGKPKEVVHFEIDTSTPLDRWRPVLTWSKSEYLSETVWNPSGVVDGARTVLLEPNGLEHPVDMKSILSPYRKMDAYPRGFTILHEENVTMGRRYGVRSKFVYALHPKTMDYLMQVWRTQGTVRESDLVQADNVTLPLTGTDHIGVYLEYDRKRVYYTNEIRNAAVVGTNATCAQVAVGVFAALFTWMYDRPRRGVHFVGDVGRTLYRRIVFDNMRVEERVFRRKHGRLEPESHDPFIRAGSGKGPRILL